MPPYLIEQILSTLSIVKFNVSNESENSEIRGILMQWPEHNTFHMTRPQDMI